MHPFSSSMSVASNQKLWLEDDLEMSENDEPIRPRGARTKLQSVQGGIIVIIAFKSVEQAEAEQQG